MKPRIKLAETKTSDGKTLTLHEHDGDFSININGQVLMHSKTNGSAELLGKLGVEKMDSAGTGRVMIGGLGLGFTLQSVLECVGPQTKVEIVELIPEVIEWNREFLKALNGSLLDDSRVEIRTEDVTRLIRKAEPASYDAILLDVDNGPVAMVAEQNASLYSGSGIRALQKALKSGGRAVIWSAGPDQKFEFRLRRYGFKVKAVEAPVYKGAKRAVDFLYVADMPHTVATNAKEDNTQ